MNNLSVSEVKFFRESRGTVTYGFNIERPAMGDSISGDQFVVSGWVLGKTSRAVDVNVLLSEEVIAIALISINRPDVERAYPAVEEAELSGFRVSVPITVLQSGSEINVIAKLADGRQAPLAKICFEKQIEIQSAIEGGNRVVNSISDQADKPSEHHTQMVLNHRNREVDNIPDQEGGVITRFINSLKALFTK